MDKNDIIEYVMTTPHNTNRAVLSSMLNQLAEDGGGGSSDFSIATVAFSCPENGSEWGAHVAIVDDLEDQAVVTNYVGIESGITTELKVPLYKGKCIILVDPLTNIVCTGAVSCEYRSTIIITGNGSISAEADLG